jgi:vanillate O-demethylase monooxygenase subunit
MEPQDRARYVRSRHAPSEQAIEAYYAGMRPFWFPVLPSEELADKPVAVELLGEWFALARLEGEAVAFDNLCRHLGAALALGDVVGDGCYLRCTYHGWSYDKTGRCVDIPARRGVSIPKGARVRTYPTREAYGLVWVCLDEEPRHDIPEFPEFDDPGFHREPLLTSPWRASATRVVMATLDDSHFPWVHPGILGDRAHPEPPDHRVWREGDYLMSAYDVLQPDYERLARDGGSDPEESSDDLYTVRYTNYVTPTTIRMVKSGEIGTYTLFFAICPAAHDRTVLYGLRARNFDKDPANDREYVELQIKITEQDIPIVESQRPWLLPPLSARLALYVRPADLPLIEYQKWLEELGVPQI